MLYLGLIPVCLAYPAFPSRLLYVSMLIQRVAIRGVAHLLLFGIVKVHISETINQQNETFIFTKMKISTLIFLFLIHLHHLTAWTERRAHKKADPNENRL